MTPVPLCRPQASQEGPPGDALRSPLLCPQPQALGQSILQAEMDCELHSSLQVCGPLPWAASGAGLVSFPVVGTTRAPAPPGAPGHWLMSTARSPCSAPWTPASAECCGVARSPPAACWTRPSARRPGRARRRSGRRRGPCPVARAGGTRWPRSPPSPRAHLRVSVPRAAGRPGERVVVRAARG